MKICFLEVGPKGPIKEYRTELLKAFGNDYFFVTHDEYHKDAMCFNKGKCWAENRNYLAINVPKEYDYYWFSDYDVNYISKTDLSVYDQIIKDLTHNEPAVMVCHDESKVANNFGGLKNTGYSYKNIAMSNNHMKIVHKDLIDWFFPMPTKFGGIHDCCHYFNVLECPFLESVICTYNVECFGTISESRSQGGNMTLMHKELEKRFVDTSIMPTGLSHQQFKLFQQNRTLSMTPKKFINDNIHSSKTQFTKSSR